MSGTGLTRLPEGLNVGELLACDLPLSTVPASLKVRFRLALGGCVCLSELPHGLSTDSLSLQGCLSLEALPEGLDVCFLNIGGCEALRRWPSRGRIRFGHLSAQGCLSLRTLPDRLTQIAQLDLSGCRGITSLPKGLRISGWLDVAGSGITSLEDEHVPLRWRGVRVDARIAFRPEELKSAEILRTENCGGATSNTSCAAEKLFSARKVPPVVLVGLLLVGGVHLYRQGFELRHHFVAAPVARHVELFQPRHQRLDHRLGPDPGSGLAVPQAHHQPLGFRDARQVQEGVKFVGPALLVVVLDSDPVDADGRVAQRLPRLPERHRKARELRQV
ncbi:hypothetical protein Q0M94_06150 [Deinococcus radiomollis]|uniref:hypothetical protein n=1 Tax=Deinococcus radiomollis TaxID=468916 RepID=UPI0038922DE5